MKITLINKDDSGGGAAMACSRLFRALKEQQADVQMLVQRKTRPDEAINSVLHSKFDKVQAEFNFLYERVPFILKERDVSVRFAFSTANAGMDISGEKSVQDAALLHLHWINGAFLSLDNLSTLFRLHKPIVWTLHDMWPFTGGCHYSGVCNYFHKQCGDCYFLKKPYPDDISHTGWLNKQAILKTAKLTFIACSNWMREEAGKSSLFQNFEIVTIPNPIDTETYTKLNKHQCRQKWNISPNSKIILFGAANINHKRKGIKYLIEALSVIKNSLEVYPDDIQVVVFGKGKGFDFSTIPFPVVSLPVIKDEKQLAEIYNLADVFVLPSLEDNLPNMVMEALACAVPVVAFDTGGVKDMVEHFENGYLAEYKSVKDLAHGIVTILNSDNYIQLSSNARQKVVDNFSNKVVAEKHIDLYHSIISGYGMV